MSNGNDEFPRVGWTEIAADLGELPYSRGRHSYEIPASVPDTASEFLVYAKIRTGDASPYESQDYRIWVEPRPGQSCSFRLAVVSHGQPAWSYNSDNFWLPLPRDRHLFAELSDGTTINGSRGSDLRIIGYR